MRSLLCLFCLCWSSWLWAQQAGKVDYLEGSVRAIDPVNKERQLKLGDAVNEGETILTGADGEAHLAMEDGAQIGIHANTRLRVVKYKADGGKDDQSIFSLLQGAMRSVTGWIGKYNPRGYEIRTPTATIGVRGTDHETRVIPEGSSEGEPGTYDKVNIGATQMRTQYGTTEIRPNRAGFVSFTGQAKPRLLERVPGFFRPLRNEARFVGLHDKIKQRLPEQRAARVKQIGDTRKQLNIEKQQAARNERQKQKSLHEQQRQQYQQKMEQRRQERQRDLLDKHQQQQQMGERRGRNEWMQQRQPNDFERGQAAGQAHPPEHEKRRAPGQHLRQ